MFGIHDFGLFLTTGILLNLAPGPDTAYIVGRSDYDGCVSSGNSDKYPCTESSAGHDADKFDPVAIGQFPFRPFTLVQRDTVVLNQNGLRRELITLDQFGDCLRATRLGVLAIERNGHLREIAWSQSFQTGSSPRRRKTLAISEGERSSLISN